MNSAQHEAKSRCDAISIWTEIEDLCFTGTEESLRKGLKLFHDNPVLIDLNSFVCLLVCIGNAHFLKFQLFSDIIKSLPQSNIQFPQTQFASYLYVIGIFSNRNIKRFKPISKSKHEYEISFESHSITSTIVACDFGKFVYHFASNEKENSNIIINNNNFSLLDLSAFCGSIPIFQYLLINGHNIKESTVKWSVCCGNENLIEIIEHQGFSFINQSINAIKYHHIKIYEYLTSYFQNDEMDFSIFIKYFSTELLLNQLQSINDPSILSKCLHFSCSWYHFVLLKYLIQLGASIEIQDDEERTLLINAADNGYIDIARYLIDQGADVEAEDNYGSSALIYASLNGHINTIKLLIENGANIEIQDGEEGTPLIYASNNGFYNIVQYLIESGANIDAKDNYGRTSLIYASLNGHFEVVKLLIKNGANIEANDDEGKTPLTSSLKKGFNQIANYLIGQGAKNVN